MEVEWKEILKEESGDYLIVVLNGNNQVVKIKIETGEIISKHIIDVAFVGIGENGHLAFSW